MAVAGAVVLRIPGWLAAGIEDLHAAILRQAGMDPAGPAQALTLAPRYIGVPSRMLSGELVPKTRLSLKPAA